MRTPMIRRAAPEDAQRLTSLVRTSGAYRGPYAAMVAGYDVTPEYVSRHEVFAAVGTGNRILGFYALILAPPELDLAFVADDAQGAGVGRLLMEHMLTRAGEAGLSEVRVIAHPPAEPFYRRMGAERVGMSPPIPPKVTWERPELRFALP
ncbi:MULTISPECIES: GNAT family N-acetyltransferase [Streptomyces]|uniref:N-acetyltransferase domain-containing protein n=2 Tax=Streptomyces fradiae ATCC 10745 = DSM 40063 TaxID=1319510 RepID=A0ABQ6XM19_STRFR|nr:MULTISPECIES: GNAT family N-acetyltransferase [Streptomyces]KAF0646822.1 hypothetical protein K701_26830 [Streptomyces fradiae ATCC 10745 = DSM 40063]QEV14957.1 GNAT family N-acetyltransferase [Streptomyces fradiae ATCC 10745 = DSM 40063]